MGLIGWIPACAGMTEKGAGMAEKGAGMTLSSSFRRRPESRKFGMESSFCWTDTSDRPAFAGTTLVVG
jgi:hypothetical protein